MCCLRCSAIAFFRRYPRQRHKTLRLIQICDRLVLSKFLRQRVAVPDKQRRGTAGLYGQIGGNILLMAPLLHLDAFGDAAAEGVVEVFGAVSRLAFRSE